MCRSRNDTHSILPIENLRRIVRRWKVEVGEKWIVVDFVCWCRKSGQFFKDFSFRNSVCFSFFTMPPNDRGYGHLAVCGSIRCRGTTKWMREQNCRNARQPANGHRRVLGGRCFVFFVLRPLAFESEINSFVWFILESEFVSLPMFRCFYTRVCQSLSFYEMSSCYFLLIYCS